MTNRSEKERRYLLLQAELKRRFKKDELLQLLIYEDTYERVLIFDPQGFYLIELTTSEPAEKLQFRHYPLDCLQPLVITQCEAVFYLTVRTLRARKFQLPFADQLEVHQVATEINRLWSIFW